MFDGKVGIVAIVVAVAVVLLVCMGCVLWACSGGESNGSNGSNVVGFTGSVIEPLDASSTNPTSISITTLKPTNSVNTSTIVGGNGVVGTSPSAVPSSAEDSTTLNTLPGTAATTTTPAADASSGANIGAPLNQVTLQPLQPGTTVATTNLPFSDGDQPLTLEQIAAAAIAATAGTCNPPDGEPWGKPGGTQGTLLNSKCCQPPSWEITDKNYGTCDNRLVGSASSACLNDCCSMCSTDRGKYDPTWYQMCMCGCAMCCNNQTDPHFAKHGTCSNYIHASPGVVKAPEAVGMFTPSNWRGYINAYR